MRSDCEAALAVAETHLADYPPDLPAAEAAFRAAHSKYPDDPRVMERLAAFLAQFTHRDREAVRLLKRAMKVAPTAGRHFALAQLQHGKEAEDNFLKGIAMLEAADPPAPEEAAQWRRELGQAYCAIGELFMTDLCDEEDAQQRCLYNLQRAAELDTQAIPTQNALANFYRIIGEMDKAKQAASACVELVRASFGVEDLMDEIYQNKPLLQMRQVVGATLLDLEMTEEACEILHGALSDDEDDPHSWFLLALSHWMAQRGDAASDCADRLESLIEGSEMHSEWADRLTDLRQKIQESRSSHAEGKEEVESGMGSDDGSLGEGVMGG